MKRSIVTARWRGQAAALLLALCAAGCGSEAERPAPGSAADARQKAEVERRLVEMETQLAQLKQQSQGLRRELEARVTHLDAAHDSLAVQVEGLRSELIGRRSALPLPGAEAATAPAPIPAAAKPAPAAGESASSSNWIIRLLLLIVIVTAIGFIARIFFGRWGAPEEAPYARAPEDSGVTDLGKIRAMGGAPPAAPESGASSAETQTAPLPFADDPEEQ